MLHNSRRFITNKFNPFIKINLKNFQNKIRITKDNLKVLCFPSYNQVSLIGLGENSIKDKTFIFGKNFFKNIFNLFR